MVPCGALAFLALGLACQRGEIGATADTALPLECPKGASATRVDFPDERGGGFAERCMLSDGVSRHGPSREWDRDGRRRAITHWWQGMRHGKTTFWFPNGQKSHEVQHYRWQATGVWTTWDEQGKVTESKDFGPPATDVGQWPMPELGEPPDAQDYVAGPPAGEGTAPAAAPAAVPSGAPPAADPRAPDTPGQDVVPGSKPGSE
jgi:hypothetical protein